MAKPTTQEVSLNISKTDIVFLNNLFFGELTFAKTFNGINSNTNRMVIVKPGVPNEQRKSEVIDYLILRYGLQPDIPVYVDRYTITLPSKQTSYSGEPCRKVLIDRQDDIAFQVAKFREAMLTK